MLLEQPVQHGLAKFAQGENLSALLVHRADRRVAVARLGDQPLETMLLVKQGLAHSAPIFGGCGFCSMHASWKDNLSYDNHRDGQPRQGSAFMKR